MELNLDELYLRVYGDPVLREKMAPVTEFGPELETLVRRMYEIMYEEEGVGLAAPQAGAHVRVMVLDVPQEEGDFRQPLVNPVILASEGEQRGEEGCLSFPGLREEILRAEWIHVRAENLKGETFEFEATGLLSRAVQHELDHLDGVLFIDRMSAVRRRLLAKKLKKIAADRLAEKAS